MPPQYGTTRNVNLVDTEIAVVEDDPENEPATASEETEPVKKQEEDSD